MLADHAPLPDTTTLNELKVADIQEEEGANQCGCRGDRNASSLFGTCLGASTATSNRLHFDLDSKENTFCTRKIVSKDLKGHLRISGWIVVVSKTICLS